ncbi:hypothetical protein DIJ64_02040 [Mycobacterium leprae]|uniref:Uncharacterized protein n=1 Tax=Mycobacterium leprae TaxID=1769 RepID=A0AAD0KSU9_MYCLR|nr:hypothetical protein DIJ64_02040 [Mycobacterium leprae]OAR21489.1 hypothetical protein A8144_05595 [Mycobacterium leprae 3125609]OAX71428.1 hypothetical protein A3216_05740 [Mycobacterium leprae 7935681]
MELAAGIGHLHLEDTMVQACCRPVLLDSGFKLFGGVPDVDCLWVVLALLSLWTVRCEIKSV